MSASAILNLPADHYWLKLHRRCPSDNFQLELLVTQPSENSVAFVENFRTTCFEHLGSAPMGMTKPTGVKHNNWFLQGNSPEWVMFEFWTKDEDAILEGVLRVLVALEAQGLSVTLSH